MKYKTTTISDNVSSAYFKMYVYCLKENPTTLIFGLFRKRILTKTPNLKKKKKNNNNNNKKTNKQILDVCRGRGGEGVVGRQVL